MAQRTATPARVVASNGRRRGLLRLALVAVLIIIAAGYISPAYSFYTKNGEIEQEKVKNAALQSQNDGLLVEMERLQQEPYIEAVARKDLGLVKPGERPFIVEDISPLEVIPVAEATPEQTGTATPAMPAVSSLFSSE